MEYTTKSLFRTYYKELTETEDEWWEDTDAHTYIEICTNLGFRWANKCPAAEAYEDSAIILEAINDPNKWVKVQEPWIAAGKVHDAGYYRFVYEGEKEDGGLPIYSTMPELKHEYYSYFDIPTDTEAELINKKELRRERFIKWSRERN